MAEWWDDYKSGVRSQFEGQNVFERAVTGLDWSLGGALPNKYLPGDSGVAYGTPFKLQVQSVTGLGGQVANTATRAGGQVGLEALKGLFAGLGPVAGVAVVLLAAGAAYVALSD